MAGLTPEQRRAYDEQGYVLLKSLLEPDEIQRLVEELEAVVDRVAREYKSAGRIDSLYEDEGFKTRLIKIVEDDPAAYDELVGSRGTVSTPQPALGPEMFRILSHPELLDIVEGIVGPEIRCEGRHRLRSKLPGFNVADFRWHEDTAYAARRITYVQQQYGLGAADASQDGAFLSRIVAEPQMAEPNFWIPLVDVDEENGCLQMLPGGHLHTTAYEDEWTSDSYVGELDGLAPVAVPMQVGDALLIHQHLPHASPPNRSDHIRWSLDIRFQDDRRKTKSVREPGFLARSDARPQDVVTEYAGYVKIREAVKEFQRKTKIRL